VTALPIALQERLLDELVAPGHSSTDPEHVHCIATSRRDLEHAQREGALHPGLAARLGARLRIPPLRERPEDIAPLAERCLARHALRADRLGVRLSPRASELLRDYPWPGNTRELDHVLERALILSTGAEIGPEALCLSLPRPGADWLENARGKPLQTALDELERSLLLDALERSDYVQTRAAEQLGLSKSALHYKLARHGIRVASY
jgi:DNA-binding NtrC family response regulator